MTISLDEIKKLRKLTRAGVMDCRRALTSSKGDIEKAKKWLKDQGMLTVQKKAGRTTKAGLVEAYVHANGQVGSLVKLVCETDFVSRTADFKELAHELALQVASMDPKDVKDLLEQEYIRDPKQKIKNLVHAVIAKTGENIKIELIARLNI